MQGFKFIDLHTSAERLGTTRTQVLQWVDEGRLKPFSGKGQQSVFRVGDIERLAQELGAAEARGDASTGADVSATPEPGAVIKPRKRRDPIKLIGTRLSMDSRWAEITDADIVAWLDATEPVQFERVRKVANLSIERLQRLLQVIDEAGMREGKQ